MNTYTVENYLKAIYKYSHQSNKGVSTNVIADELETKPSSVTDMIKKLADKKLIHHKKYQGVKLTKKGLKVATIVIRKHRLWEVFLVEKLNFRWDEVHEIAEQLEHIQSDELVKRLNEFLEFPKFDPHGDPIPDKEGNVIQHKDETLADLKENEIGIVVGVKEHSKSYLNYLENLNLVLGAEIKVDSIVEFDATMRILVNNKKIVISNQASKNLIVKKN